MSTANISIMSLGLKTFGYFGPKCLMKRNGYFFMWGGGEGGIKCLGVENVHISVLGPKCYGVRGGAVQGVKMSAWRLVQLKPPIKKCGH